VSGYFRAASLTDNIMDFLPYATVGISVFESPADVADVLEETTQIMPAYDDLEEIDDVDLSDADAVRAFIFASPNGEGEIDSIRIFAQVDDQLITIDVQGAQDEDEALDIAMELAEAQLECALGGPCVTGGSSI
jgi:hypothetical protein